MNLQTFATSKTGTGLAMWLGRNLPRRAGTAFIELTSAFIARRRKSPLARSIRANQSVVRDLPLDAPELDVAVRQVLRNAGRYYYDLYHLLARGREAVREAVSVSPDLDTLLRSAVERQRPAVVLGPHTSNFDLAAVALGTHGFPMQMISYSAPPGGYELQNEMRTNAGYIVTPADGQAAKTALKRLRAGGLVCTGVDRPLPEASPAAPVRFFGRPTALPTGYARLALATDAQLLFISTESTGPARYRISGPEVVELVRTGNRRQDAVLNAERVLALAEEVIRARPEEWMMFFPVWPELLEEF